MEVAVAMEVPVLMARVYLIADSFTIDGWMLLCGPFPPVFWLVAVVLLTVIPVTAALFVAVEAVKTSWYILLFIVLVLRMPHPP